MQDAVIQFIPSVLLIIIGAAISYQEKKRSQREESHRAYIEEFLYNMTNCIISNNETTIEAITKIQRCETNGGLTSAINKLSEANTEFRKLMQKMASKQAAR